MTGEHVFIGEHGPEYVVPLWQLAHVAEFERRRLARQRARLIAWGAVFVVVAGLLAALLLSVALP